MSSGSPATARTTQSRHAVGLLDVAGGHQRVEGERRVAQPAEAVVPVAHAADELRQRRGGRGDDPAGRRVRERLERDQRALDLVGPPTRRRWSARPTRATTPSVARPSHGSIGSCIPPTTGARLSTKPSGRPREENSALAWKSCARRGTWPGARAGRGRPPPRPPRRSCASTASSARSRSAAHVASPSGTSHGCPPPREPRVGCGLHRHAVGDLATPSAVSKSVSSTGECGRYRLVGAANPPRRRIPPGPVVLVPEQTRETRCRVEPGQTTTIDRHRRPDQRGATQIADQPVILDRQRHRLPPGVPQFPSYPATVLRVASFGIRAMSFDREPYFATRPPTP